MTLTLKNLAQALRDLRSVRESTQLFEQATNYLARALAAGNCVYFRYQTVESSLKATTRFPATLFGGAEPQILLSSVEDLSTLTDDADFQRFLKEAAQMSPKPLVPGGEWRCEVLSTFGKPSGVFALYGKEWQPADTECFAAYVQAVGLAIEKGIYEQKVSELSIRDSVTGLFQPKFFNERMNQELALARRLEHSLSLLAIRIDHFQDYAAKVGRDATLHLEQKTAELIKEHFRSTDWAARTEEGCFEVLLTHTSFANALEKADKFRAIFAGTPFLHEHIQPGGALTVSIGVAEYPSHGHNREEISSLARGALVKGAMDRVFAAQPASNHIAAFTPRSARSSEFKS